MYFSDYNKNSPITFNLLVINGIFFLAKALFESAPHFPLVEYLGVYYFDSPYFKPWQLLTYMFTHGNTAHLLFNMFALFTFGPLLEFKLKKKRYLILYFVAGFGALALQYMVQAIEMYMATGSIVNNGSFMLNTATGMFSYDTTILTQEAAKVVAAIYQSPMVGASGAIFGLLTAFGILFPEAEMILLFLPIPIRAKFLVPIYILLELVLGVAQISGDSVAHFAHIGGALFGFALLKIWKLSTKDMINPNFKGE